MADGDGLPPEVKVELGKAMGAAVAAGDMEELARLADQAKS
jgi:hypothetical protein